MELTLDIIKSRPDLMALAGPEADDAQPGVPYPLSNDNAIVDTLRAETVPVIGELTRQKLIQWATLNGQRSVIADVAGTAGHPLRDIAITLQDILGGALDSIDMSDTLNVQMLDAWLDNTEPDTDKRVSKRASLMALATHDVPKWPDVSASFIAALFGRLFKPGY